MANLEELQKKLILELKTDGFHSTAAVINKIIKGERAAGRGVDDLTKKYGTLNKAVRALIKTNFEAISAMKRLVMPPSFGSTIRLLDSYNKSLLSLSARTNRLGIGITDLEKSFIKLSKTTSLTRLEIVNLFKEFEAGMRFISLKDFESIMKRIHNIVGANEQEISKMAKSIASISQKYPLLSRSLQHLADTGEDLTKNEKESLKIRIRTLYIIGKISDAEYKSQSAFINANKQISNADRERQQDITAQIAALKEMKTHMQEIALAVGQAIMPALEGVKNILTTIFDKTDAWGISMAKIGGLAAGGMLAGGALSVLGGSVIGKFMIKGGKAGGIGGAGVAGAVGKKVGIPVYVTNWAMIAAGGAVSSAGGGAVAGGMVAGGGAVVAGKMGWLTKLSKYLIGLPLLVKGALITGGVIATRDLIKYHKSEGKELGMITGFGDWIGQKGWDIGAFLSREIMDLGLKDAHMWLKSKINPEKYLKEEKREEKFQELLKKQKEQWEAEDKAAADRLEKEEIRVMWNKEQIKAATVLGNLQKAQSGYLDIIIQKMAITGQIDNKILNKEKEKSVQYMKAEVEAIKEVVKILTYQKNIQFEQIKNDTTINKGAKKIIMAYQKAGEIGKDTAEIQAIIIEEMKKQDSLQHRMSQRAIQNTKIHDIEIQQAKLLVTQAGIMVQLADNYAIGVGASKEMRMELYYAEEKHIKVLEQKLVTLNKEEAMYGKSREIDNERLNINNQITQAMQRQAQQIKALRDGWISALSAMNSGFGGFMEIIMDANKGLSQMQRLSGSLRRAPTGAFAKRDARGRIIEDVGYNVFERFTYSQSSRGIAGVSPRPGRSEYDMPYYVPGQDTKDLEMLARQNSVRAINKIYKEGQKVMKGDPTALVGSGKALEAFIAPFEQGGGGGVIINNNLKIDISNKSPLSRADRNRIADQGAEEIRKEINTTLEGYGSPTNVYGR